MAKKIIGITGYAQHGKNTIADILVGEHGFQIVGFADALRAVLLAIDPIVPFVQELTGELVFSRYSELLADVGYEEAKKIPEVRRLLQVTGTEAGRNIIGPDVWVDALEHRVSQIDGDVVIPDVRFANEVDWILDHGTLWGVERYNDDWSPFDNKIPADHPSEAYVETALTRANWVFHARTIAELRDQVVSPDVGEH